jgi:hypothetical protein
MLEPIAPAKNKTDKTVFMVFISLTSLPAFRWPSSHVTWLRGKKFLPKQILLWGIFCGDAKFQRYGQRLRYSRGRNTGRPYFNRTLLLPLSTLKFMKKGLALSWKKNLCSRCWKMPSAASKTFVCATDNRQKKWFLEAEEWFNEEESGYSPSRISVTPYDLILSTLGKD